jgi:hypothetical protein
MNAQNIAQMLAQKAHGGVQAQFQGMKTPARMHDHQVCIE